MTTGRRDDSLGPWAGREAGETSTPSYRLLADGGLHHRAEKALALLSECRLCPGRCGAGGSGRPCGDGTRVRLHSCGPLFDIEYCLRGSRGSAAFHPANCNLRCVGCQNWRTRWVGGAATIGPADFATLMLQLQAMGCHNINLISPAHIVSPFLQALPIAAEKGLHIPIVYSSCGYDSAEALRLLDGIVDIYVITMKYSDPRHAQSYSDAPDYVQISREAVREMHRQVGDLVLDEGGLAQRGLIVRHQVLPGGIAGPDDTFSFVARNISADTAINVRHDYQPYFRTRRYPEMDRRPAREEMAEAVQAAARHGLYRFERGSLAYRFLGRT